VSLSRKWIDHFLRVHAKISSYSCWWQTIRFYTPFRQNRCFLSGLKLAFLDKIVLYFFILLQTIHTSFIIAVIGFVQYLILELGWVSFSSAKVLGFRHFWEVTFLGFFWPGRPLQPFVFWGYSCYTVDFIEFFSSPCFSSTRICSSDPSSLKTFLNLFELFYNLEHIKLVIYNYLTFLMITSWLI